MKVINTNLRKLTFDDLREWAGGTILNPVVTADVLDMDHIRLQAEVLRLPQIQSRVPPRRHSLVCA